MRTTFWACVLPVFFATSCQGPGIELSLRRELQLPGSRDQAAGPSKPQEAEALRRRILARPGLQDCLAFAAQHSPRLRAGFAEYRAALHRVAAAGSWPEPTLGFMQFVEELQTRTGPQERRYQITQKFPWFGKLRARAAAQAAQAEAGWQQVVQTSLELRRDVALAWFEYGYLARNLAASRGVLQLLQQLEPVLRRRIQGGQAGQAQLLRLQVEIGRLENEVAALRDLQPALRSRLAAAMHWPRASELATPELPEPAAPKADETSLQRRALQDNPRLLAQERRLEAARQEQRHADLGRWPDFSLGLDYFETGSPGTSVPGAGDDPFALRVAFSLPITPRIRAQRRAAEQAVHAASLRHQELRAQLRAELSHGLFRWRDATRQVSLYRDTLLPRAREALEVTRTAFSNGQARLLEVIDSERALLQFETAYWRACRDQLQARARLEVLIGGIL